MRILFAAHWWLPFHAAGAEVYGHTLMKALSSAGHLVKVLESRDPSSGSREPYTYDGVQVVPCAADEDEARMQLPDLLPWADVLFGHLENTARAAVLARFADKPCWIINHNDHISTETWGLEDDLYYVDNSLWMSHRFESPGRRAVTVRPPIDPDQWDTGASGEHVTLINLNPDKGSDIFYDLARLYPDICFLGVRGFHGEQNIPEDLPDNVEIVGPFDHEEMLDKVYRRTKILLMPSKYESWGQAANEAMSSGIPVVYSAPDSQDLLDPEHRYGTGSTYGLQENVATGGIPCRDLDQFSDALEHLSDGRHYRRWSRQARERSRELWTLSQADLDNFVQAVEAWI